jgi:hypothetical protein
VITDILDMVKNAVKLSGEEKILVIKRIKLIIHAEYDLKINKY